LSTVPDPSRAARPAAVPAHPAIKPPQTAVKPAQPEVKAPEPDVKEEFVFCHVCRMKNLKSRAFCRACETNLFTEYDLPPRYYQTSNRVVALNNFVKMVPTTRIVEVFLQKLGTPWVEAQFLGGAVKISDKQFPDLYHAAEEAGKRLAVPRMPRIYITYSSHIVSINSPTFSMGTNDDPITIVSTTFANRCSIEEWKFMIARELGHIKCGHPLYLTTGVIAKDLASAGAGFALPHMGGIVGGLFSSVLINQPLTSALNAWYRAANYTADKAAMVSAGDVDLVKAIFAKMLLGWYGKGGLQEKLNLEEFMAQYDELEDSVGRYSEYLGPMGSLNIGIALPTEFNPGYQMPLEVRRLRELLEYSKLPQYAAAKKIIADMEKGIITPPEQMQGAFCGFCGSRLQLGSGICPACGREN
jgi:Zn-dependent protease with chaperone function